MILAALAAAAISGKVSPSPSLRPPDWLSIPAASDMARVAPDLAVQKGIDGGAVITCAVNPKNRLDHCDVKFEAPEGLGFGTAALRLAPLFHIRQSDTPGQPITIPVVWQFPNSRLKAFLIANPLWEAGATFADVASAYPKSANGKTGSVELRCRVNGEGRVGLCTPLGDVPSNQDFARAASTLTDRFRLKMPATPANTALSLFVDLSVRLEDPASADFQDRHIGEPDWLVGLDPDRMAKLYPTAAAAKGLKTGRGVARCVVRADGALANCRPRPGDPDGVGFSEAAVVVASGMRMSLWTRDGGPVDGANVSIPIRFNLATSQATAPKN